MVGATKGRKRKTGTHGMKKSEYGGCTEKQEKEMWHPRDEEIAMWWVHRKVGKGNVAPTR